MCRSDRFATARGRHVGDTELIGLEVVSAAQLKSYADAVATNP
jgi:hypothetical protein